MSQSNDSPATARPDVAGQETSAARRAPARKRTPAASRGCPPEIRAALSGPWPSLSTLFTRQGEIDFRAMHGVLELAGFGKRYRRPPYHSLSDEQMEDLAAFLKKKSFL